MSSIESIIADVINAEKGYVNDPADRGGETNYGITVVVARNAGYNGPMKDLPRAVAEDIYRDRYIVKPKFDAIVAINHAIGAELVDTGVNMGPHRAAEFLQRWLNAFNDGGGHYQSVFVDGRVGTVTIQALKTFLAWRGSQGVTAMLRALNGLQASNYLAITEKDPSQRRFIFGWIINRVQ